MKNRKRRINWRRFLLFILFILIIFVGYNRVEAFILAGGLNNPGVQTPAVPDPSPGGTPDPGTQTPTPTPAPDISPTPSPEPSTGPQATPDPESESSPDPAGSPSPSTQPENTPEPSATPSPPPTEGGEGQGQKPSAEEEKRIALTFDDGPDELWTPQILDILREYGIKATFFIVGYQAEKYPAMIQDILDEGHEIGNHTWSHKKLTELNNAEIRQEITRMETFLIDQVGEASSLLRAPYGAVSDNVRTAAKEEGYDIIGWSVDTRDWAGTTPADMMEIAKVQAKADGIVLMHSFGGKNGDLSNTVEFLPQLIDYLKQEGFTFMKASEII